MRRKIITILTFAISMLTLSLVVQCVEDFRNYHVETKTVKMSEFQQGTPRQIRELEKQTQDIINENNIVIKKYEDLRTKAVNVDSTKVINECDDVIRDVKNANDEITKMKNDYVRDFNKYDTKEGNRLKDISNLENRLLKLNA